MNIVFTDFVGSSRDLSFLQNDEWLTDAAVIPYVLEQKGRWRIIIVFAWINKPLQLICRRIPETYPTKSKAETFADYYKRTIQKDKRGTLTIHNYDFNICYN